MADEVAFHLIDDGTSDVRINSFTMSLIYQVATQNQHRSPEFRQLCNASETFMRGLIEKQRAANASKS